MNIQRLIPFLFGTKKQTRTLFFVLFFGNLFFANAQVKEMIDMDAIQTKIIEEYKSISPNVTGKLDENIEIEPNDVFGSGSNVDCVARAIRYSTLLMNIDGIKNGIKKSAETTVKVFGSTLKAFGFGYVTDGVKILSLLDDVQKEGGDADDFAKAIAQYAFDKGSGKLLDKAKKEAPGLFDDETLSGEGMKVLADLAKTESGKFFNKFIHPPKEELFNFQNKSSNCKEYYYGEIVSNEDEIIADHTGPVLIIRIGFTCKCTPGKTNELKTGLVRYNIPLDLVKNPKAWAPDANIKRTLFTAPPDYIYVPLTQKVTIKATADCCDSNEGEDASYTAPLDENDLMVALGVEKAIDTTKPSYNTNPQGGVFAAAQRAYRGKIRLSFEAGATIGEESDFYGINYAAQAAYIFAKKDGNISFGPEVGYSRFTGKETESGFKPDGVGFMNTKARGNLNLNHWLEASGAVGYGFGLSDGIDGGVTFDVGLEATPAKNKAPDISSSTRIYYSLRFKSNSVEGGSFNSVNAGVGLKF